MFETWFDFYQHCYYYHKIKVYIVDANLYRINPELTIAAHPTERGRNPKSTAPFGSGYKTHTRGLGFLPSSNNETLRHNFNASFNLPDEVLSFALSKNKDVSSMNELDENSGKGQKRRDDYKKLRAEGRSGAEDLDDEVENDVYSEEAKTGSYEAYRRTEDTRDIRKQLKVFRHAAHLPSPVSSSGSTERNNICGFCHCEYGEKDDPWLDEPWYECSKCRLYCHAVCLTHHQEECRREPSSGENLKNLRRNNGNIMHVYTKKIGAQDFPSPTGSVKHRDLDATEDFDEGDDLIFDDEVLENGSVHSERLHSTPKRARLDPKRLQTYAPAEKRSKSRKQTVDSGTDSEAEVTGSATAFLPLATAATSVILATPVSSSSNNTSISGLKKKTTESTVSPGSISPSILTLKKTGDRIQSSVMCKSVPTRRKTVHSVPTFHCLELPEVENTDE